jgi:hypothetical protein
LPGKIAILPFGEDLLERLSVGQPSRFGPSSCLYKFLLH